MILFGLHGGLGNSLFCLPAIKALARHDEVRLVVDGDYPMSKLWERCRYAAKVYGPGEVLPKNERCISGQYVPPQMRGRNVEFCGWSRGTFDYPHSEWEQVKLKSVGNKGPEDVTDWIEVDSEVKKEIDFAVIPGGKPGEEWKRKRYEGMDTVARLLREKGYSIRAFGLEEEIHEARLDRDGIWAGRTGLDRLPEALSRCRYAISTDSGVGHLASSIGIPTVMLFTATSPIKGRPLGTARIIAKGCSRAPLGCQSTRLWPECSDWICRDIEPGDVVDAALKFVPNYLDSTL